MKNEIKKGKDYAILIIKSNTYGRVETMIDIEDIERVKKYIWRAVRRANNKSFYFATGQNIEMLLLHRFLMNCPEGLQVGHINKNSQDNRKQNLRICDVSTNMANRSNAIEIQSGEKFIYWDRSQERWIVRIMKNRMQVYCGCSKDLKEAIKMRDKSLNEVENE